MARTAADVMVDTLLDWGVDVVFGLPGDGINGIMESLRTRQDQIRFIQVRHEEAAAFAACGYAKFTGKLGVCLATSGPGGIHLLNGLYDAKLDGQPVLAITGHTYHDLIGTYYQQDVDLDRAFIDVAHYSERVMGPGHVEAVTNLACRHALAQHGVAHVNFPVDIQELEVDEDAYSKAKIPGHTTSGFTPSIQVPPPTEIQRAADLLNRGEKVAILAGRGALGAGRELELLADKLGAPIVKAYLGKAAVPDDSPFTTGAIGLFGTKPSEVALEQCDTLLMVGTSFPYMAYLPEPGSAAGVQIDSNPVRIGLRYPVEIGLVGDAKATLEMMLPYVEGKSDRSFLEEAQSGMKDWRALMEDRGTRKDTPMKPQVVAWELNKRLAPNAIIAGDSGTTTTWLARYIQIRGEQMVSGSGNLATMASALPYAISAQVAYPERQVVAIIGDGAFSQLMAELSTAVKYQLPVKIIVFSNYTLGQIKWEQMVFLGNPEYGCELHPIDFAKFAEACGATGFRLEKPSDAGKVLDKALSADGPVVVDAIVDPYEPPMPAQVTADQAIKLAKSLARGEPNRVRIAQTLFRDKVVDLLSTPSDGQEPESGDGIRGRLRKMVKSDE
jgi:pyruvate dehydrogenase (quinone)